MKPLLTRSIGSFAFAGALLLIHCGGSTNLGTAGGTDGGHLTLNPPLNHFPAGATCRATRPAGLDSDSGLSCDADAGAYCPCESDSACTSGNNGRCVITGNGGPHCTYDDCATSSDCATGTSCACGDITPTSFNQCVPSNCRVDTDCGANGYCSPSLGSCGTFGGQYEGVYCHTASDECTNDSDCKSGGPAGSCAFSIESLKWLCQYTVCAG